MALNFFMANTTNIFVFNNHTQSNAFATGVVMVFGDALYNNYSVGAALPMGTGPMFRGLQIAGNVNVTGGTNYTQDTIHDPAHGSVINYSMINLNGTPNQPLSIAMPTKQYVSDFLYCSSIGWASSGTAGLQAVKGTALTLTGTDAALNSFILHADNIAGSGVGISAITSIDLVVPAGSTIIVSIDSVSPVLNTFTTLMNGVAITPAQASYVLWNFPQATSVMLNTDIYGALLAPFASISSTAVAICGTLMTNNLSGAINGINNLFAGTLPDLYNPSASQTCSSFTTTSTTTTTTTTTTSTTMSTTTCAPQPREQAITDLIESVALEQAALSHILNAEGEKIQKVVALKLPVAEIIEINKSVEQMTNTISKLELILHAKLESLDCDTYCDKC